MAHGFFKALRAQHLSSASIKNGRRLVGMIQCTLNRLNIAVLLEKVYCVDFPEAVRRHVLVEAKHLRSPLDSFQTACRVRCPSPLRPGNAHTFPACLRIAARSGSGKPTMRRFFVFCSVTQKRGLICSVLRLSTSPTLSPVCKLT